MCGTSSAQRQQATSRLYIHNLQNNKVAGSSRNLSANTCMICPANIVALKCISSVRKTHVSMYTVQSTTGVAYTCTTCSSIVKTSTCWCSCNCKISMLLSLSVPSFSSQDRAPALASTHNLSNKLSEKAEIAFSNAGWICCPSLTSLPTSRYNTLVVALRRAEGAGGPFPSICAAADSLPAI